MAQATSTKRALIDKANTSVVIIVSVAAAVTVFSLVATRTLFSQVAYQNRVISAKRDAVNQLKDDIAAVDTLKKSYDAFVSTSQNAIGGNPGGTGQRDGDNASIVLDALPSAYDFPSLTTNLDTLINGLEGDLAINSITGIDDEVAQAENQTSSNPEPSPMPFSISLGGDYASVQRAVDAFERSIRPIKIQKLSISGSDANLVLSVDAQTYYQPAKSLNILTKVVE